MKQSWENGRSCIGCGADDVDTNWANYCDACLAAYEQSAKDWREGNLEIEVSEHPRPGDVIETKRK